MPSTHRLYKSLPAFGPSSYEFPPYLKVALGQLVADGLPLPADWALAWVEQDPLNRLRTPAHRCPDEFRRLFHIRYSEKFGNGCLIKPNKTKLKAFYKPASNSFGRGITVQQEELSDVTALTGPLGKLKAVAQGCTNELDSYSRYLGRNPSAKATMQATALLPVALVASASEDLKALSEYLNGQNIVDQPILVKLSELLARLPGASNQTATDRRGMTMIAQVLSKMGYAIEPDQRFGGFALEPDSEVVLLKTGYSSTDRSSPQYAIAATVLHLASTVAEADGPVSPEERAFLEKFLAKWPELTSGEGLRLKARIEWLCHARPDVNGIKGRVKAIPPDQKAAIGRLLVELAQVDGNINAAEVRVLLKAYGLLGLDVKELYSEAHRAATEPVTVEAGAARTGFTIPSPPKKSASRGIGLDKAAIDAKLSETAAVAEMLEVIFAESESQPTEPERPAQGGSFASAGLDEETLAFVRSLVVKSQWTRQELEQLVAGSDLMVDGTLDMINDVSFDLYGEPFSEGDDPLVINGEIAKEICL